VARKIILLVVLLIVPGGLVALAAAWLGRTLAQTERGRKAISFARARVPAWMPALRASDRLAA
jgi:hypothetical protein